MSARQDAEAILSYLKNRYENGNVDRYAAVRTIKREAKLSGAGQYPYVLLDDLENMELICSKLSNAGKSRKGVPRVFYQITIKGIDFVSNGGSLDGIESSTWTGRIDMSEQTKKQIQDHMVSMKSIIEQSRSTNVQKANALAIVESVDLLLVAPDPPWPEIMRLLRSPTLNGITGIASLVLAIVGLIIAS